ncbi:MAG: hypothetical protein KDD44_13305, partial [Bdellovibrionales bacterium]|nr:hypothetical protein [Bdellovibrionales bacterium]
GETWAGLTGHVQRVFTDSHYQQITGAELNPEQSHVFLCGNPAMISDMQQLLESRDFRLHKRSAPGSIHVERYW